MITINEVLSYLQKKLGESGHDNAFQQAEYLLLDVIGCSRSSLFLEGNRELDDVQWKACIERLKRTLAGEPLQYIHGEVDFYHCKIKVNRSVLIPRQETEILVDKIVKELEQEFLDEKEFWDVCCGSGCIGIAIKKRFPRLRVFLSDISPSALEVARANAKLNGVEVACLEGDLLLPFKGKKFDYLVCNPPYIAEAEYDGLDREVREFEPKSALVSGQSGIEVYERLSTDLPDYAQSKAKVWLELGYRQGKELKKLFDMSFWKRTELEKDWSGQDRFFFLENE